MILFNQTTKVTWVNTQIMMLQASEAPKQMITSLAWMNIVCTKSELLETIQDLGTMTTMMTLR